MTMNITSADELRQKIEEKRYDYFTFPVLDITIKYRKPDLLKLSFNNSLPSALAAIVINSYKEAVGGTDMEEYQKKHKDQKLEADDDLVKDLDTKGYILLSELAVSHRFLDVEQSDPENNLIAWKDVPEEDAIAFLLNLINKAQVAKTATGGEVSGSDIASFPDSKRVSKRNTAGKGR